MKKLLIIFVLVFAVNSFAIDPPTSRAQGIFLSFGVGPRLPVADFSNSTDIGYGFNVEVSYTDDKFLPLFLFANIGYEQYPGAQSFYQETDYSNFSTNAIPINIGIRYYFSPLVEQVVLLIPIVELSASYAYTQELNEFKPEANRNNFKEQFSKFGASGGVGISMFLMEIIAAYHYFESNQYLSFDLRIRIPLIINY